MLYEAAKLHDTHITMTGEAVPFGCPECVDDIEARIVDVSRSRDKCSRGTAARSHYSGVLHQLRKDRRSAKKIYEADYLKEADIDDADIDEADLDEDTPCDRVSGMDVAKKIGGSLLSAVGL